MIKINNLFVGYQCINHNDIVVRFLQNSISNTYTINISNNKYDLYMNDTEASYSLDENPHHFIDIRGNFQDFITPENFEEKIKLLATFC